MRHREQNPGAGFGQSSDPEGVCGSLIKFRGRNDRGRCGHQDTNLPKYIPEAEKIGGRYLTLVANVEGEDIGRASRQVAQAIAAAGEPLRGVRVEPMGQLPPMIEMFEALGIGSVVAVFVIFVLLTA